MTVHEDKGSLRPERELYSARGQLVKAAKRTFDVQRGRPFMMSLALSSQELEAWCMWRDGKAVSSGVLPLTLTPDSPGLQVLCRMLIADAAQLGYFTPLAPSPFSCSGYSFENFEPLSPWGDERVAEVSGLEHAAQEALGEPSRRFTGRHVYSAIARRPGATEAEEVVLKFYPEAAAEVSNLPELVSALYHLVKGAVILFVSRKAVVAKPIFSTALEVVFW